MYMYLSDRIRRMFLSGACPQNLSPKKPLSLKDQRFLQKTKADKNLTRIIVKQQKLLYEKHIGLLLQRGVLNSPMSKNSNSKNTSLEKVFSSTPVYLQVCSKAQKTIKTQKNANKVQNQSSVQDQPQRGGSTSVDSSQKKLSSNSKTFSDNIWKTCSNYNFPRKSLTLFVQSLKVKKRVDLVYMKNEKKDEKKTNYDFLEKGKMSLDAFKLESQGMHALHDMLVNHARQAEQAMHASFNPGKTKYTSCRYLYDHESLKTCIVPQLFKNQKPISRAKTLLHERKKIALLYGQLAKKDILNISRKAISIPGFFEDNMFTLLESRVDVCVFRAGFSKTIAGARQLIRNGSVLVNGKKISSCKRRAKPGDYFTFTLKQSFLKPYRYTTLELYNLCLSSNFYREWVSMNKIKIFRELVLKQESGLKKIEGLCRVTPKTFPESLLFQSFAAPFTEHYKPAVYSLYWGFFLYKLYKIPSFSCFFETKRKSNILINAVQKSGSFSGLSQGANRSKALPRLPSLGLPRLPERERELKQPFAPLSLGLPEREHQRREHSLAKHALHARDGLCFSFPFFMGKKKNIVLLNLYTQLLLKKIYNLKTKQNSPFFLFRKNISSSNLWAIWGQKPLHLEISHKTGAFIYMYKPQKIISPVCLDFEP